MAAWWAKKNRKTCDKCKQFKDPDSFGSGVTKVLKPSFFREEDCLKCEVMKNQPIAENENIIDIYNAIPPRFDPYSGDRIITAQDIQFMMDFYEVPKKLHFDYFHRVVEFHKAILKASYDEDKKEKERKEDAKSWTEDKLSAITGKNVKTH